MGRPRIYEKCFFCNKKFNKELGRHLDIIQSDHDGDNEQNIGKSFVCFQCEVPCSTAPEFNEDGSFKKKDKEY